MKKKMEILDYIQYSVLKIITKVWRGGSEKPTKHDHVINGESLAHAVHGFGYENNKHMLFP